MRALVFWLMTLSLAAPAIALTPAAPPVADLDAPGASRDGHWSTPVPARRDTLWFGGDDGTGTAYLGGVWDWDTIVSDPLQGWQGRDLTADPDTYFYRVTEDSFIVHGDPCTPMFAGSLGQLWCGVHEDDARLRDFVGGMGYGNNHCQRARSPLYDIAAGDTTALEFRYFNDTEAGFDYTYVRLRCFLADGEPNDGEDLEEFTGQHGSYEAPAFWSGTTPYGALPPNTARVQLEFEFRSDGGWSDEDGAWTTECGPFAADDIQVTIGGVAQTFDFEDGPQGWTFERCPGIGSFMRVWDEATWMEWVEESGLECCPSLSGNVLGFCQPDFMGGLPGFPQGHREMGYSGVVDRGSYLPPDYNSVYVRMAGFAYLRFGAGTFVRPGWSFYPYSTEINPEPHWSPRGGQDGWTYTGDAPYCAYGAGIFAWDLSAPPDGDPIPVDWERMRFIFETVTDCEEFFIPSTVCLYEGETNGSPLIDRVQVGLAHTADAPPIVLETGAAFIDGFGQNFPEYLEPGDVGNSNVERDLSLDDPASNDWNADTAVVTGSQVTSPSGRWLSRICFRVERAGPRQQMIPGYAAWRQRLAYAGDPEVDFVCVQMDSVQFTQGAYKNKFATFFHEADPGFDPSQPDCSPAQEILPDLAFVPGTRVRYYYESWWYNDGAPPSEYYRLGPDNGWEYEILPGMRLLPGAPYAVEWPSVLYVDAYNRGAEARIRAVLDGVGLAYDIFDYGGTCSCYSAPMKRSYGGTHFNPGGWGNNGCTLPQLLGYRLILLDTGDYAPGALQGPDFELFRDWLGSTECGIYGVRRGFIFSGDEIAHILDDPGQGPVGRDLLWNTLGATYQGHYRELNQDEAACVYLEPAAGAVFTPAAPGVALFGNECPGYRNYSVLGLRPGIPNVTGNLRYYSYEGTGSQPYVDFAQVVRQNIEPGVTNWKTILEGGTWFHLAARDCLGDDCSPDSACVVQGALDLVGPELAWLQAGGTPFVNWRYPCEDVAVDEESDTHLSGPVTYLHAPRPNPFRGTAALRFSLARATPVTLDVFDVSGRRVRRVLDAAQPAGENTVVWDGADDAGHVLGRGLYWVQLRTGDGYVSSRRMLQLR